MKWPDFIIQDFRLSCIKPSIPFHLLMHHTWHMNQGKFSYRWWLSENKCKVTFCSAELLHSTLFLLYSSCVHHNCPDTMLWNNMKEMKIKSYGSVWPIYVDMLPSRAIPILPGGSSKTQCSFRMTVPYAQNGAWKICRSLPMKKLNLYRNSDPCIQMFWSQKKLMVNWRQIVWCCLAYISFHVILVIIELSIKYWAQCTASPSQLQPQERRGEGQAYGTQTCRQFWSNQSAKMWQFQPSHLTPPRTQSSWWLKANNGMQQFSLVVHCC